MGLSISKIFIMTAISTLAAVPGTGFACAQNDINCYWNFAEAENRALDQPGFSVAVAGAVRALALSPDATPVQRAAVLRLMGLEQAMNHDRAAALRLFQEARRLDPSAALPEDLYPPAHPFAKLYAAADPALSGARVAEVEPVVEDPPVTSATWASNSLEAPPPARRWAAPLLLGAATSAALSGGLYAWSMHVPDAEGAVGDDAMAYAREAARSYARQDGLRTASGGVALLGVGLLTAGLTVVW